MSRKAAMFAGGRDGDHHYGFWGVEFVGKTTQDYLLDQAEPFSRRSATKMIGT